jgi:hypothetical protein
VDFHEVYLLVQTGKNSRVFGFGEVLIEINPNGELMVGDDGLEPPTSSV